jgi:hypothetical protein
MPEPESVKPSSSSLDKISLSNRMLTPAQRSAQRK